MYISISTNTYTYKYMIYIIYIICDICSYDTYYIYTYHRDVYVRI